MRMELSCLNQELENWFYNQSKASEFKKISRALKDNPARAVNVTGPPDAMKAWLGLSLAASLDKKPCFIVSDELKARRITADLKALSEQAILVFRPRDWVFTDADAASHELEQQRMSVLSRIRDRDFGALVIPIAATLQKLPPENALSQRVIHIKTGEQVDPDQLSEHLLHNGYERVRVTDGPGQWARRGDIIDVVLPSPEENEDETGVRLSFFDNEVDAIKLFDPENQRSYQMESRISIPPVREIVIDHAQKDAIADLIIQAGDEASEQAMENAASPDEAHRLSRLAQRDAERIRNGINFSALDRWAAFITPDACSILDYIHGSDVLVLMDEPLHCQNRLDAAQADFDERIRSMLTKGQVLPIAASTVYRSTDVQLKIDRIRPAATLCQLASPGNGWPGAQSISIAARPSDGYRGREKQLVQDVKNWSETCGTVVLFAGSKNRQKRLSGWLDEQKVHAAILPSSHARGFVWPGAALFVVGTQDVFGSERATRRRHRTEGIKIDLFSDLVPGEYVVHDVHGIGRYDGLVNMETNKSRRDYLKITYAGDDSLYIPMESLDQIQKFVGAGGRKPKCSKLGGQEWTRMKERAQSSIRKLAVDLVRLYAERSAAKGHRFAVDTVWQREFEERFPFEETRDQRQSIADIKRDMESDRVMDRLLCGDVGFGKTEVAFRAIFKCVMDGKQAMMLAPTTVLAQQHYENIKIRMDDFAVRIGLLSRFASESQQKKVLQELEKGTVDVVIGTHRLLSKDVHAKNLGLLVVDEEQRFGVDHKEKIKTLWPAVDVLTLTATPIPRTLHMAMSGIRDISVIEEPPRDRRPVQTYVMAYDPALVAEAILRELGRKGQVFYLYNDTRKIAQKAGQLADLLPGARVAYAHAQMSEKRLEDVVSSFIKQESDVLVCTTLIESGIDMPNVNTIIVENADRLGLAQLYQLRGRVGRSDRQAYAYITYQEGRVLSEVAEKRLAAIRDYTELGAGFKIALRDLEVRGAGNLLGAEQHGHLEAIGYDLYCRMLEEAIREIKGQKPAVKVQTVIELDVDAFIPSSYISDEGLRLDMYRRVAAISSFPDYQDVLDEWFDRFGDPPLPALTLADIAYIRCSASRLGLKRIGQHNDNLVMRYHPSVQPDMGILSELMHQPAYKGKLLFNAGTRPYLVYRKAAQNRQRIAGSLRQLFMSIDPGVVKKEEAS